MGGVKPAGIKERAIQHWTNDDAELGAKLRANLSAAPLSDAEAANKIGWQHQIATGTPPRHSDPFTAAAGFP
ncbi:hypothetical protein QFZ33_002316 [Arthrobacter globiformis]|nr:hypothetical protein [Arthrobacter globiformis]